MDRDSSAQKQASSTSAPSPTAGTTANKSAMRKHASTLSRSASAFPPTMGMMVNTAVPIGPTAHETLEHHTYSLHDACQHDWPDYAHLVPLRVPAKHLSDDILHGHGSTREPTGASSSDVPSPCPLVDLPILRDDNDIVPMHDQPAFFGIQS